MTGPGRVLALPLVAVVLVAGTLVTQLLNGGGSYEPLRPPDACTERVATSRADGIDGLTEQLVLLGVADAACTLGVSREALTLELAQTEALTGEQVDALRSGLQSAVEQLDQVGALPPASSLLDEVLEAADLNSLLELAIRALPDGVVDAALPTDDVLSRAIDELDLPTLLANLDDPADLDAQIEAAVTQAVQDSLLARVQDVLGG